MYPYIHIVLPSYGVMAFIGCFFTMVYLFFKLDKYSIEFLDFLKLFGVAIVGVILGSKALFSITQLPRLANDFSLIKLAALVWNSGFVYYGGLFGALFALKMTTRKNRGLQEKLFHMIVPAIPLFHAFGRIGCMMGGCCYGKKLDNHLRIGWFEFDRIPVQIMEASFEFLMFVVFLILEKKNSKRYSLRNYLILYAIFRFFIEFYRGDKIRGIWMFGLSTAQLISILILVISIGSGCLSKQYLRASVEDSSNGRMEEGLHE